MLSILHRVSLRRDNRKILLPVGSLELSSNHCGARSVLANGLILAVSRSTMGPRFSSFYVTRGMNFIARYTPIPAGSNDYLANGVCTRGCKVPEAGLGVRRRYTAQVWGQREKIGRGRRGGKERKGEKKGVRRTQCVSFSPKG